jgi:hypothetical protein
MSRYRESRQPIWDFVQAAHAELQIAKHRYEYEFQRALFIEAGGCEFEMSPLNSQVPTPPPDEEIGNLNYLFITTPLQEAYQRMSEELSEVWRWEKEAKTYRSRGRTAFRRGEKREELLAKTGKSA